MNIDMKDLARKYKKKDLQKLLMEALANNKAPPRNIPDDAERFPSVKGDIPWGKVWENEEHTFGEVPQDIQCYTQCSDETINDMKSLSDQLNNEYITLMKTWGWIVAIKPGVGMCVAMILWDGTACITFLTVVEDMRGRGIHWNLIKSLISFGWDNNVKVAYHLAGLSLDSSSEPIQQWRRPLNIRYLRNNKIGYPSIKKQGDKDEVRDRMFYKLKDIEVLRVDGDLVGKTKGYSEMGDGWEAFCETNNVYLSSTCPLDKLDRRLAIGTDDKLALTCCVTFRKGDKSILCASLVWWRGDEELAYRSAMQVVKKCGFIFIRQVGDTPDIISSLKAQKTNIEYLHCYNTGNTDTFKRMPLL